MKRLLFFLAVLASATVSLPHAQMRVVPVDMEQGHVALGLALRHLSNTGVFMQATAHPDDENNGLLVMLNRGLGYRTALATATRGNGGQNEIGPELFEALGVLRTEELTAMHRFDGAEQYFTRAVDFGYSFSVEETFEKWGQEEIIGDFVRLIRMIRPDVILSLRPDGTTGGLHHQASAMLAREAFQRAGDPLRYADQLTAGLRPWQPKKFYIQAGRFGGSPEASQDRGAKIVSVNLATYDRLLGRTYAEIGTEARSMHKCQGMAQLLALPGPANSSFQLVDSNLQGKMQRADASLFDGVDASIEGLAEFAGPKPPRDLTRGLGAIASLVKEAQRNFDTHDDQATLQPLLEGLRAVRAVRAQLRGLPIAEDARFEIDFRLRQKEREFQQAIVLADSIRVEALADDGTVVPGQPVRVSLIVANRGTVSVNVGRVGFDGFAEDTGCALTTVGGPAPSGPRVSSLAADQVARCDAALRVPEDARISEPYWHRAGEAGRYTFDADAPFGLPYRPTPFYVQVTFGFGTGTEEVIYGLPVQYRYQGNIFSGEKRAELLVVPPLSVRVSPEIGILPLSASKGPSPTATATAATSTLARGATPGATGQQAAAARGRGAAPSGAQTASAAQGRGGATTTTPQRGRGAAPGRGGVAAAPTPPPPPAPRPSREVRVTVVNLSKGPAASEVALELPQGWTASPASETVSLSREDESRTVRFQVSPPDDTAVGNYQVHATAKLASRSFNRGYQLIEYPHIRRQHIYYPADTTLKVMDVRTAPDTLTVGYIMGVGDEVPQAIEQLGVKVEALDAQDLAWGDLARFNTIVTGIRAYEARSDLRANNERLLEYVRNGGTLVVQYNKLEFNEASYGPYPAKVSTDRVTDENAPVSLLTPFDPVFTSPNQITDASWQGWVQERGLYFLGERDSRYRDLVQLEDPFPNNRGVRTGALVTTTYGKGRWTYVGLGLWRELTAGVDGSYQLLANLISTH